MDMGGKKRQREQPPPGEPVWDLTEGGKPERLLTLDRLIMLERLFTLKRLFTLELLFTLERK